MSGLEIPSFSESLEVRYKSLNEPLIIRAASETEEKEDKLFNETLKENLNILGKIKIPDWFDQKQIVEILTTYIEKDLKEDELFKVQERVYKYTRNIRQYLKEYFDEIYNHTDNLILYNQNRMLNISMDFLNSDLPPSFLRIITLTFKTEQRFYSIYNKKIKKEEFMLRMNFNNRKKFSIIVDEHNEWVGRLDPFLDDMIEQCIALIWYVDIWNSKSLDELFKNKIYRMSVLDKDTFEQMLTQLESMTTQVRKLLIRIDKEEFAKAVNIEGRDQTIALFTNSMIALNEL